MSMTASLWMKPIRKDQAKREDEGVVCREGDVEAGPLRRIFRERELPLPFPRCLGRVIAVDLQQSLDAVAEDECGLLGRRTAYGRHAPKRPFHWPRR